MAKVEQVFAVSVADGRGEEVSDESRSGVCARAEEASQEGEESQFRGCWVASEALLGWENQGLKDGSLGGNCSVRDTGIEATCAVAALFDSVVGW